MAGEPAARSGSEVLRQLQTVTDIDIRRPRGLRPELTGSIHPRGAQTGRPGGLDIQQRVIADIHELRWFEPQAMGQPFEAAPIGLGGTDAAGIQRHTEEFGQPDTPEVRIAVAESPEQIARSQSLQPRTNVFEQVELIARGDEDFECLFGDALVVTVLARVLRK